MPRVPRRNSAGTMGFLMKNRCLFPECPVGINSDDLKGNGMMEEVIGSIAKHLTVRRSEPFIGGTVDSSDKICEILRTYFRMLFH